MYKALRGMKDTLPVDSLSWQVLENKATEILQAFGYARINTPILEEKGLFVKSIGDETDIVSKEMFAFRDRGERDVVLRPEGTAPIVRAYLEANLHKTDPFQKFYYFGPMFRAERPQAGRLRQFHQIGAEAIGSKSSALDAEMILLITAILDNVGVENYKIHLNNLGCRNDKKVLSNALKDILDQKKHALCDDCKNRLDKNPLRVLDCKKENCRNSVKGVLKSIDFLCEDCRKHFDRVKGHLKGTAAESKCVDDAHIVRGLDYYTGTVFEVSHSALGAQDAIGAGGRYDNLVKDIGGPEIGAVGFALGIERLLMAGQKMIPGPVLKRTSVYIATIGESASNEGFKIARQIREAGIICNVDYENKSLKAQMREADKLGCIFTLIIGDDEIARGEAVLRDMRTKEQSGVILQDTVETLKNKLKTYNL